MVALVPLVVPARTTGLGVLSTLGADLLSLAPQGRERIGRTSLSATVSRGNDGMDGRIHARWRLRQTGHFSLSCRAHDVSMCPNLCPKIRVLMSGWVQLEVLRRKKAFNCIRLCYIGNFCCSFLFLNT